MFQLGQVIFYLLNNQIHSARVLSIMKVENLHEEWTNTKEQKQLFAKFGPGGTFYSTTHTVLKETDCFASKEDLAQSLSQI